MCQLGCRKFDDYSKCLDKFKTVQASKEILIKEKPKFEKERTKLQDRLKDCERSIGQYSNIKVFDIDICFFPNSQHNLTNLKRY